VVEELAAIGHVDVTEALEWLPANERDAVRARVIEDRDYHDIAGELECSESVVRQRVSRGLARARIRLSTQGKAEG
jgi:RNA polymerase sigma factor (sigma-70 family)